MRLAEFVEAVPVLIESERMVQVSAFGVFVMVIIVTRVIEVEVLGVVIIVAYVFEVAVVVML